MKKRNCIIGIVLIVLALLLIFALSTRGKKTPTWQEQYDLGVHHLSEGNYADAINTFAAAIEIDSKQSNTYVALADAYVFADDLDKASQTIAQGETACGENAAFDRMKDALDFMESDSEGIRILNALYDDKSYCFVPVVYHCPDGESCDISLNGDTKNTMVSGNGCVNLSAAVTAEQGDISISLLTDGTEIYSDTVNLLSANSAVSGEGEGGDGDSAVSGEGEGGGDAALSGDSVGSDSTDTVNLPRLDAARNYEFDFYQTSDLYGGDAVARFGGNFEGAVAVMMAGISVNGPENVCDVRTPVWYYDGEPSAEKINYIIEINETAWKEYGDTPYVQALPINMSAPIPVFADSNGKTCYLLLLGVDADMNVVAYEVVPVEIPMQ